MGMLTPTHEMRVSFDKLTGEQLSKARAWVLDTLRQRHGTDFGLK